MSRRDFLKAAALGLAGLGVGRTDAVRQPFVKPFKFLVFTDIHYLPGDWTNDTPEFLEKVLARAERENCQMVIQLGDMIHGVCKPSKRVIDDYLKIYNDFKVPSYHVLGNHDTDYSSLAETMAAFRMEKTHYYFDMGGFRFVVCDPNYTIVDGRYVHHELGNYFKWAKSKPFIVMPPEQLEWLMDVLRSSPYPCVVFSHEGFERPRYSEGVWNKDAVQGIFHEVNVRWPRHVLMSACGHYHVGNMSIIDNIPYWEVNGANFFSCGRIHKCYPPEYAAKHVACGRNIAWAEPLSAVVSLYPNGRIKIDGKQSEYLFGVTCEKAGFPNHDDCGRIAKPEIENADFNFLCGHGQA